MSLSMSGTPIIVTVSPDSAELTANGEVENGFCVGTFFFPDVEKYICRKFSFNVFVIGYFH